MNFNGFSNTTFLKENHSLSKERITVMTSVSSLTDTAAPLQEFVLKPIQDVRFPL